MKKLFKNGICLLFAAVMFFGIAVTARAEEHEHSFGNWYSVSEDTRRRTCSCGEKDTVYRLHLPTNYSGPVFIENNPGGFYCGTRNVADVLNIKEGTFSNGEITVAVEGTKITATGTVSKTAYFDLQTGTFGVPDYKRDPGYSLPDGNYRFTLNGSGSRMPTVCIRTPDGQGNLMVFSQNGKADEKNNIKSEDFGIPYLYFPKNATYDYSGNLVLTIGANSIYDTQISKFEFIQNSGDLYVDGFLWSAKGNVDIFGYRENRLNRKNEIIYSPDKGYISIFSVQPVGKLEVQLNLANNSKINAYGWRLNMMYACDNNYTRLFPITQSGEYEMAIKLAGRPDFIGMGAHGSEQMTDFSVFIDGTETALENLVLFTEWENIRIIRKSDMYDPADEATVVGKHFVEYLFDEKGLTVNQTVEWLTEDTCYYSYMMMFPVRRKYNEIQITDTYYDDFNFTEYNVSDEGFTGYPVQWTSGASKMTLLSKKSGITATMESLASTELLGGSYKMCSNSASYNKLYFTVCGAQNTGCPVSAGDIWNTSTRYEVVIENGTEINMDILFGDINLDGKVNTIDANYARRYAAGLLTLDERQKLAADVSGDGEINVMDSSLIRRYVVKYIDSFPAENK